MTAHARTDCEHMLSTGCLQATGSTKERYLEPVGDMQVETLKSCLVGSLPGLLGQLSMLLTLGRQL